MFGLTALRTRTLPTWRGVSVGTDMPNDGCYHLHVGIIRQ